MKTILVLILFLTNRIVSYSQGEMKIAISELDSTIQLFLPSNWVTVKTDSSVHIYFAREALNSDVQRNQYLKQLWITDATMFGSAFIDCASPDSVYTELISFERQNWSGEKQDRKKRFKARVKNYKPNNILKIDIYAITIDSTKSNKFGFEFDISATCNSQYNRIIYLDPISVKEPYYQDKLGNSLSIEYDWVYLSTRLLIGKSPR